MKYMYVINIMLKSQMFPNTVHLTNTGQNVIVGSAWSVSVKSIGHFLKWLIREDLWTVTLSSAHLHGKWYLPVWQKRSIRDKLHPIKWTLIPKTYRGINRATHLQSVSNYSTLFPPDVSLSMCMCLCVGVRWFVCVVIMAFAPNPL